MSRSRIWQITVNNPTEEEFPVPERIKDLRYCMWQKEIGGDGEENVGTPHFHAHLEFKKSIRFNAVKKMFPRAHIEQVRDRLESMRYCCKASTRTEGPFEYGSFDSGGQGKRNDVVRLYECVKEGKSNKQILEEVPAAYMRYYKAVHHVRHVLAPKRDFMTKVYVIWGATGLGKTHWASEKSPSAYYKQRGDWWDEYDGSSDVIIDDFYGWLKYDTLLRICDKYPCQVEIKGGHVNFAPKRIFITSNAWPNKWYDSEKCYFDAFARRVHKWIYFTGFKEYTQAHTWDGIKRLLA